MKSNLSKWDAGDNSQKGTGGKRGGMGGGRRLPPCPPLPHSLVHMGILGHYDLFPMCTIRPFVFVYHQFKEFRGAKFTQSLHYLLSFQYNLHT